VTDIWKLHDMVWTLRNEIHTTWPTPEPMMCIRYAVTEAAETMDAWLRIERPGDARNHAKNATLAMILGELADCAMMLLSALGPEWDGEWQPAGREMYWKKTIKDVNIDSVCVEVGSLLWLFSPFGIVYTVKTIADYPGMDIEVEMAARLAKIRVKHVACTEVQHG